MTLYNLIYRLLLQKMDAERAHERTLAALRLAQANGVGRRLLRRIGGSQPHGAVSCFGLTFPNRLGIAAGFDKDVQVADALAQLGFGHVEVGTLTPRPQAGNPRPRIFRLPHDRALINRMGFPNCGVAAALPRLRRLSGQRRRWVLGVSIGKQKETPLVDAASDYLDVMQQVYQYADYLAVNVSSPNTPGLRQLQGADFLDSLLQQLQTTGDRLAQQHAVVRKPLLLKIAPDIEPEPLRQLVDLADARAIAGLIVGNTTLQRDNLISSRRHETGGLSGAPLRNLATERIRQVAAQTTLPIIGVGGIFNAGDASEKLSAGAHLLQMYTGLIYEGPTVAGRIVRQLNSDREQ